MVIEPTTDAGKRLLHDWDVGDPGYAEMAADVLAIESEAVAADRASLAEKVRGLRGWPDENAHWHPDPRGAYLETVSVLALIEGKQPEHDWHSRCDVAACNCGRCHQCGEVVPEEAQP
jgi:hypothetical protein